jgi:hypothetical protein
MKAEAPRRLLSIDALRGLDMVWIVGGSSLLAVWAEATRWEWLQALEAQCPRVWPGVWIARTRTSPRSKTAPSS